PTENGPANVPKRKPANLKPPIRAVEASEARFEVIRFTRCDPLGEDLEHAREIIRVHRIAGSPVLQLLQRPTAVFDEGVVDEVDVTGRCQTRDKARNTGQDQLGATLVDALGGLYPLTLRRKFLPQRVIGCGQLARPFRDELDELLVDSRLFAHGALLTAYRWHPSGHLSTHSMRHAADHRPRHCGSGSGPITSD